MRPRPAAGELGDEAGDEAGAFTSQEVRGRDLTAFAVRLTSLFSGPGDFFSRLDPHDRQLRAAIKPHLIHVGADPDVDVERPA